MNKPIDKGQQASLQDLLNYAPESYLTMDEMQMIQNTFKNNYLLKILRKVLLPSVGDPEMPLEEMAQDVWMVGRDYAQIPSDQVKAIVLARQEAIKFVMGGLIKLKVMANDKRETSLEKSLRQEKDSTK